MKKYMMAAALMVATATLHAQSDSITTLYAKIDTLHQHIYQDRKAIGLYTWSEDESTYPGEPVRLGLIVPPDSFYVPRLDRTLSARAILDTLRGEFGEIGALMSPAGFKRDYADGTTYCLDMELRRFADRVTRRELGLTTR